MLVYFTINSTLDIIYIYFICKMKIFYNGVLKLAKVGPVTPQVLANTIN